MSQSLVVCKRIGPYFSVAPDDAIVFSYEHDGTSSIYIYRTDGTSAVQIRSSQEESYLHPVFSPDGSRILYLSSSFKQGTLLQSLWVMNRVQHLGN